MKKTMQEWDWEKIKSGFSMIKPDNYLRFDVDLSGKSTVYITIVTEDGVVIADALARKADYRGAWHLRNC